MRRFVCTCAWLVAGACGGDLAATDTRVVDPPVIVRSNPSSPSPSKAPRLIGRAKAGSAIRFYTTPGCTGPVAGTGSATTFAEAGIEAQIAVPNGRTLFFATA